MKILAKYILRYWFEHGGTCLWSDNDEAKNKFDYAINNEQLPITKTLIEELCVLEEEYHSYLDWDYPPNPSPWTSEQKLEFKKRAYLAYLKLVSELDNDFEVICEFDRCVK